MTKPQINGWVVFRKLGFYAVLVAATWIVGSRYWSSRTPPKPVYSEEALKKAHELRAKHKQMSDEAHLKYASTVAAAIETWMTEEKAALAKRSAAEDAARTTFKVESDAASSKQTATVDAAYKTLEVELAPAEELLKQAQAILDEDQARNEAERRRREGATED